MADPWMDVGPVSLVGVHGIPQEGRKVLVHDNILRTRPGNGQTARISLAMTNCYESGYLPVYPGSAARAN